MAPHNRVNQRCEVRIITRNEGKWHAKRKEEHEQMSGAVKSQKQRLVPLNGSVGYKERGHETKSWSGWSK